ncbi:calcineurin-like phosphoesterase C-terminal domain-containing protein [Luteococcus sp. OSA5]|uniref:calcineurin-like phosphoesterase C-terminal domain-containing protein n=1 Tax=Luteococcus sp. OSA5 TaxID=3401630 RepID=UPI003B430071
MIVRPQARRATIVGGLSVLALGASLISPTPVATAAPQADATADQAYRGQVQVVPGKNAKARVLHGSVFHDADRDSVKDRGEKGIAGVAVSNGRKVVTTDRNGNYKITVDDNTTVFVTQPAGYQVPVDEANVAQFYYNHMPQGSPKLKYGGMEATGPLPKAVNFGMVKSPATATSEQECIIGGDIQTYTKKEAEYAANGAFKDLNARTGYDGCGALFIGDIVGDDLSLYPGIRELTKKLNGPARFLPGNHDMDYDAKSRAHMYDTFRDKFGPTYHSYDVGRVHVVSLDTVDYPVPGKSYNGALGKKQLEWLKQDLARVPKNKLIVVAGHIPLLTFADQGSEQHQIDEVKQVYKLLKGRKAVAVSGHTHSIENMRKGDSMAGWQDIFGVAGLPFQHITSGAISGDWYSGKMLEGGYPLAVQRDGGLPGVVTLDIKGNRYTERFTVRGDKGADQMQLGLNTPAYRDWYRKNKPATGKPKPGTVEALADPLKVSQSELSGTWLTTNFFMGSTGSKVTVSIDGRRAQKATRTQPMTGEGQYVGAEYSDPAAVQEQLVKGGSVADRSMHLWRQGLPTDLEVGKHTATVRATDAHGRVSTEKITFEVTE